MARIRIEDLDGDQELTAEELKRVLGGAYLPAVQASGTSRKFPGDTFNKKRMFPGDTFGKDRHIPGDAFDKSSPKLY